VPTSASVGIPVTPVPNPNAADGKPVAASPQAFAGDGSPTTQVPASGAGTYWDRLNKIQYQWNQTTYDNTGSIPDSWKQ
jgi:hypothetical protein